ncbi:MAG: rod shape-determining protein RodA [Acidobacteria bacterium]|nr:rod shape-determining protein RodA [Acidobacteriota bacterium]
MTSVPIGNPAASFRRNPSSPWRHLDVALVGATLAVAFLGVLMVYSATRSTVGVTGLASATYLVRQLIFVILGLCLMTAVAFIDYRHYRELAPVFYFGCALMLLAVLSPLGVSVNGAHSWFAIGSFQVQPAEFTKLAVVLLLAGLCATPRSELDARSVVGCLLVLGLPAGLILLQPDLGSLMVFVAVLAAMLLVAGASGRQLAVLALIAVIGAISVFQLGLIKNYQRDRLTYFASPTAERSQAAYNAQQAETAIGAGGLRGAGLFKGTQTKLRYVPYQHTDFIFTVVGEELGFAGSATLLLLYAVMGWRVWHAAVVARDGFGTLVCVGVLAILLFQVFENMGMTMGIMPITGIPLPFMSYGGSSTLTMFAAIGLVLNVHARRFS